MEKKQKIDQTRKARVGAIGENLVVIWQVFVSFVV